MEFNLGEEIVAVLPRLRRFAIGLCRSVEEADDLVQAACVRALAAADSFAPGTRVDSWMYRIIRNLWLDQRRRQTTRGTEVDIADRVDIADPIGGARGEARVFFTEVWTAIDRLPPDQRELLLLVCVEDLSYREAAEVLDIPVGTVMSRLARARKKIAEATNSETAVERSRFNRSEMP